jgi:hypothetical protein
MTRFTAHLAPEFSFRDVKEGKLVLLSADKTSSIDVTSSSELEFLKFAQSIIKTVFRKGQNRDLFDDLHAHDMDEHGRFYIISQLARLPKTKDLVQRKIEEK